MNKEVWRRPVVHHILGRTQWASNASGLTFCNARHPHRPQRGGVVVVASRRASTRGSERPSAQTRLLVIGLANAFPHCLYSANTRCSGQRAQTSKAVDPCSVGCERSSATVSPACGCAPSNYAGLKQLGGLRGTAKGALRDMSRTCRTRGEQDAITGRRCGGRP
jgi:hypothetical protein